MSLPRFHTYKKLFRGDNDSQSDKHILENVCKLSDLESSPLIREEFIGGKQQYHLFTSYKSLFETIKEKRSNAHFHEVILGSVRQKLKFDIDMKNVSDAAANDFINEFKIKLQAAFEAVYDAADEPPEILQYESHGDGKYSFHVIISNYCVVNNLEAQSFTDLLLTFFDAASKKYIDNVNKSTQCFRVAWCSKAGSSRIKLPSDGAKMTLENLKRALVTCVEGCKELPRRYENVRREITKAAPVDNIEPILGRLGKYMDGFDFYKAIGNLLTFRRRRPSYCWICKETHHKDNHLMVLVGAANENSDVVPLRILCRHAPGKSILLGSGAQPRKYGETIGGQNRAEFTPLAIPKPDFEYDDKDIADFPLVPTLIISANMKMGKTKKLAQYISSHFSDTPLRATSIVIVSFRQTFSANIKEKFPDFLLYSDFRGEILPGKVIVQAESLHRLVTRQPPDLLVLDESESIIEQFNSGLFKDFSRCFKTFQWLLRYSKHVIAMDAFVSRRTFRVLERIRRTPIIYHRNTHKNAVGEQIIVHSSTAEWLSSLLSDAQTKKIAVPTNSLQMAKSLEIIIKDKFPDKALKVYSSETSAEEKKEHFAAVDEFWSKLDILIYTPTVSAGVSFEREHFDVVYSYMTDQSCSVETCLQMIGRIRCVKSGKTHIAIESSPRNLPTDPDEIIDIIESSRESLFHDINESFQLIDYELDENGRRKLIENDFLHVWVENRINRNVSLNNFSGAFQYLVSLTGAKIIFPRPKLEGEEIQLYQSLLKGSSALVKEISARNIANAPEIDDDEAELIAEKIRNQEEISPITRASYEKYKLRRRYKWPHEITPEFVLTYNKKQTYKIYKNINQLLVYGNDLDVSLREFQAAEKAKFQWMQKYIEEHSDETKDVLVRYQFEIHLGCCKLFKMLGFSGFNDRKYVSKTALQNNISKNIDEIYNTMRKICIWFEMNSPAQPSGDINIKNVIMHINAVVNKMYGCRIACEDDLYVIRMSKLFSYGQPSDTLPVVGVEEN